MPIPILVIAGPSGCGKTSVAQALSEFERFAFIEGDELHPQSNIDKMAHGQPLEDADRWPWLDKVRDEAVRLAHMPDALGVIVTCSSLKKKYRQILEEVNERPDERVKLFFIFLHVDEKELVRRMQSRKGHYMKIGMLESQLKALEMPGKDEVYCKVVNANGSLEDTEKAVKSTAMTITETLQKQ
jgi:gluconokinase